MSKLNIENFIKFHLELFEQSNEKIKNISNVDDKILKLVNEYDIYYLTYSPEKKEKKKEIQNIKTLIIQLIMLNINFKDKANIQFKYLNIPEFKKFFKFLFDLNNENINKIFLELNETHDLEDKLNELSTDFDIKDIDNLYKIFAINLLFFNKYIENFDVNEIMKKFKTELYNLRENTSSTDDDISFDTETIFLSSSKSKSSSKEQKQKKILEKEEQYEEQIYIINKILIDKIKRLYYYLTLKIKYEKKYLLPSVNDDINIIINSFKNTIDTLKKEKKTYNINNLANMIIKYNSENNINYYNYGSEAYLLILLKSNITINEILEFVNKIKEVSKEKDKSIKYSYKNYLIKIGYDLAIYLYLFTNINIYLISNDELFEIIKNYLLKYMIDVNIKYIEDINKYYENLINFKNIKLTEGEYLRDYSKKIENLKKLFQNKLYEEKMEQEQLKYNLYTYKVPLQETNKETKEKTYLWFINNVILRF